MLAELDSVQPRAKLINSEVCYLNLTAYNPEIQRSIDSNNYPENPETSQLSGDVRMMVVLIIVLRFGTPMPGAGLLLCALHREEVG